MVGSEVDESSLEARGSICRPRLGEPGVSDVHRIGAVVWLVEVDSFVACVPFPPCGSVERLRAGVRFCNSFSLGYSSANLTSKASFFCVLAVMQI